MDPADLVSKNWYREEKKAKDLDSRARKMDERVRSRDVGGVKEKAAENRREIRRRHRERRRWKFGISR